VWTATAALLAVQTLRASPRGLWRVPGTLSGTVARGSVSVGVDAGLLDLGRRDLLLSFLAEELLAYAPPAQGRTAAAAAAALAGVEGAGGRALTQPR